MDVRCGLLLGALIEGYFQGFGFCQEHYVWQKEKYGVVAPLRSQDILFLVGFWVTAIVLFYMAYKLLSYALRRDAPATA